MMRYRIQLLGLVLLGGTCLGQDLAELEVDHNVQAEFATPHTDWAVPYALGKTRVLFFLRGHDTEPREVIELTAAFRLRSADGLLDADHRLHPGALARR